MSQQGSGAQDPEPGQGSPRQDSSEERIAKLEQLMSELMRERQGGGERSAGAGATSRGSGPNRGRLSPLEAVRQEKLQVLKPKDLSISTLRVEKLSGKNGRSWLMEIQTRLVVDRT